ncbi:MAG: glycosyltransferase [Thermoanaerobaculia bacterium]
MSRPSFSVLVSCYHEEKSIDEFITRLVATIVKSGRHIEIVAVNDGSNDGTFERLQELFRTHEQIGAVVDLFRNSGQAAGLTAAVQHARGEHYVLLDSDLQLDPEELPLLLAKFEDGFDVVSGYREQRRDPWQRLVYSKVANMIMRRASGKTLRDFGCTFKVYDGRIIRAFALGPHKVLNQIELISAAATVAETQVAHHERKFGRSGWTLRKLLDLNTDHLLDLSRRPFQYLGAATALVALVLILRILFDPWIASVFLPEVSNGLLLNAIVITLLVTVAIQALTGELVLRSFTSLRRKPAYIVRRLLRRNHPDDGEST